MINLPLNCDFTGKVVVITGGTFNDGVGRYLENDGWEEFIVPTP